MQCSKEICFKGSRETAEHKQSKAGSTDGRAQDLPRRGCGGPVWTGPGPTDTSMHVAEAAPWLGPRGIQTVRDLILLCGQWDNAGREGRHTGNLVWIETRYVAYFGDGYVMISQELSSHWVSTTFLSWDPTSSRVWMRHLEEICISVREVEAGTGQECENPWAQ